MRRAAILDERGFKAMLRAAATRHVSWAPRDRFLIYVLGKTGLRISEALALRSRDFWTGPEPSFIRVKTLKRRAPRTDEVLLDRNAARVARSYFEHTLPWLLRDHVSGYVDGGTADRAALPAFPALVGARTVRPLSRYQAHDAIRLYARLAGLPPEIHPHTFRHYRATQLLRLTGDLEFTRQQLRHADIRNTQAYQHADPKRAAGYLDRVAETEGL